MISSEPIIFKSLVDRGIEEQQPYWIVVAYDLEQELMVETLTENDPEIGFMFGGAVGQKRVERMTELIHEAKGMTAEVDDSNETNNSGKS